MQTTDMRFTKRTNIALVVCGVFFCPIFLLAVLFAIDPLIPSEARKALPADATDIHENYDYTFNLQGDYHRDLNARLSKDGMALFAKRRGLKLQPDGSYLATPYKNTKYEAIYADGFLQYTEVAW